MELRVVTLSFAHRRVNGTVVIIQRIIRPHGCYLLGYVFAAGLIAALREKADGPAAEALPLAVYPFLPGDAVKIIVAAVG